VCVEGRDIYNPSPEMESISPVVTAWGYLYANVV
jgi:hypothetical protein